MSLVAEQAPAATSRSNRNGPRLLVIAAILVLITGLAVFFWPRSSKPAEDDSTVAANSATVAPNSSDPLSADIVKQQQAIKDTPKNYVAWATLGLDYVQQAKVTVDPSYYPKAEGVLKQSLVLNHTDNYLAMAGQSALKAAEHDFAGALSWAQQGLKINPYNAALYGALNDALTQLGRYPEAFAAAQKMNNLQPGVAAFTRGEYVFELRGDLTNARIAMTEALNSATSYSDKAFAYYYLGELSLNDGDAAAGLASMQAGLKIDSDYAALLEGRAKCEAALGQVQAALTDFQAVVSRVPQPEYVLEYGDYLTSLGRTAEATQQYQLFETENKLFEANGVTLDTDPTLFYADHGQPATALRYGRIGIRIRPFIEMDDAYGWALHANHRDAEALTWANRALRLGTRNALFYYHRGMIEKSLGRKTSAISDLTKALAINPHFNPIAAPTAVRTLAALK